MSDPETVEQPALCCIHISDLHFGDYLDRQPIITKGHDFNLLVALSNFISQATFDKIFLTGDTVTGGDANAFQHARNFIFGTINTPKGTVGLNLPEDQERIFIIPGNHDYYWNCNLPFVLTSENYEQYFPRSKTPYVAFTSKGPLRVTVFGLDSVKGAWGSVANGKFDKAEVQWLKNTCRQLEQGLFPDSPYNPEQYADSLKVVLMHHHIFLPRGQKYSVFTSLKDRKKALELFLKCDIDMVCFGHEHNYFVEYPQYRCQLDKRMCRRLTRDGYNVNKRFIACMASTATQADSSDNSFWELKLSKDSLICQRYFADHGKFIPSTQTITQKLSRIPCKP